MRLRNIPIAKDVIAESDCVIKDCKERKGNWKEIFGNDHPLRIEVGMGKGQFIIQMAQQNPDVNYIGIERYDSVLLRAIQKLERTEEKPENLRFLCIDAKELPEVFGKGEIDRIYLNFSDPWPKDRHAKRRLTSREFLKRYEEIIEPGRYVEFKTDNVGLFDFSLEEIKEADWVLEASTYDLHHNEEMNRGNVMTEYEEKFSSQGNKICKLVAYYK
ncbi:MAG: tRNA (guanosine(46)-N7)-methyltransferase TrmB [Lachnospiraceae bacterium]|nr:tRNA (guanosine(46)-N7)-methyltransferase TrmB [Lachnospiraceae bacterium]